MKQGPTGSGRDNWHGDFAPRSPDRRDSNGKGSKRNGSYRNSARYLNGQSFGNGDLELKPREEARSATKYDTENSTAGRLSLLRQQHREAGEEYSGKGANARTVWDFPTQGYSGAHFATFPEELPRRCILASTMEGDTVLDPFAGSGTTLAVAQKLGRKAIGVDLNPEYLNLAAERIGKVSLPLI